MLIEMRIMNGSKALMAPQSGNQLTLAIEILGNMFVIKERWDKFAQEMNSLWTEKYPDMKGYNNRLHWGKHFENIKMKMPKTGEHVDYIDYARDFAFAKDLKTFNLYRKQVDDINMFSNSIYDKLLSINYSRTRKPVKWDTTDHVWYVQGWLKFTGFFKRMGRGIKNMLCV